MSGHRQINLILLFGLKFGLANGLQQKRLVRYFRKGKKVALTLLHCFG
jgi:hypothetical protein